MTRVISDSLEYKISVYVILAELALFFIRGLCGLFKALVHVNFR